MVKLTEKLMEILDDRKDELTGEDIKHIVESIQISESIVEVKPVDPKAKTAKEILQDWMGE